MQMEFCSTWRMGVSKSWFSRLCKQELYLCATAKSHLDTLRKFFRALISFEFVAIDIFSKRITTPRNNKYLLVFFNSFYKIDGAIPLQDMTSSGVNKALAFY